MKIYSLDIILSRFRTNLLFHVQFWLLVPELHTDFSRGRTSHHSQQKSLKCSTWMQSQKLQNGLCSFPKQTIQYHGNPSLCPEQQCWRSWSWMVLWRPTRPSELTPKKDVLFIIGDWNAKVGSEETPGVTGIFGLGMWNEAGQKLIEFCQENARVIANTLFQQHKRRLYTWTWPDGQHWNQVDIFFGAKDEEALYSQQKQDWELTVAQIMNSLPNSDLNRRK